MKLNKNEEWIISYLRCTNVFLGSFSCGVWTTDDDFVFHTDADSVIGFDGVVTGWRPIHE